MTRLVTVEFRVNAEPAPDESEDEAAVAAVQAALATVSNSVNHNPHADALLSHLTTYVVLRVD